VDGATQASQDVGEIRLDKASSLNGFGMETRDPGPRARLSRSMEATNTVEKG
jgi:hypothetical protein